MLLRPLGFSCFCCQREFPEEYSFSPKTWVLPSDLADFKVNNVEREGASVCANT